VSEQDEELKSPLAKATNNALDHQKKLLHATSDALDAVFTMGCEVGVAEERDRILKWVEENTSEYGSKEEGLYVKRDHFDSTSLIAFIKGENE
jgi:hypothetical protein